MKKNKEKSVTIRITEQQYKGLIDTVILEEMNKSQFIRSSINHQIGRIKRNKKKEFVVKNSTTTIQWSKMTF